MAGTNAMPAVLTLLGRDGCCLCQDMRIALDHAIRSIDLRVEEVDITGNAKLEAEYGWHIPVLLSGDEEICRHYFDEAQFRVWLTRLP